MRPIIHIDTVWCCQIRDGTQATGNSTIDEVYFGKEEDAEEFGRNRVHQNSWLTFNVLRVEVNTFES